MRATARRKPNTRATACHEYPHLPGPSVIRDRAFYSRVEVMRRDSALLACLKKIARNLLCSIAPYGISGTVAARRERASSRLPDAGTNLPALPRPWGGIPL